MIIVFWIFSYLFSDWLIQNFWEILSQKFWIDQSKKREGKFKMKKYLCILDILILSNKYILTMNVLNILSSNPRLHQILKSELRIFLNFYLSLLHSRQFHISGPDSQLTLTNFRSKINKSKWIILLKAYFKGTKIEFKLHVF